MTQTEQTLKDQLTEARVDYETEKKNSVIFLFACRILEFQENKFRKAYANYFANLAKENARNRN